MKYYITLLQFMLFAHFCCAQYFNNYTYFKQNGGFDNYYPYDSLKLISNDSSLQEYKLFECVRKPINYAAHQNIKIIDNKIFYQLANNIDTNYQLMFNINAKVSDSFYIKTFDFYSYYFISGQNKFNIQFDSFLCKITAIDTIDFKGKKRKTWFSRTKPNTINYYFIDSIGFFDFGLTPFRSGGYYHLFNVCFGDSIIHKDRSMLQIFYCNKDSFKKYYNSIDPSLIKSGLKLFPNPANNVITLESDFSYFDNSSSIQIVNSIGQIQPVIKKYADAKRIEYDINDLANGLYILKINNLLYYKFTKGF